MEGVEVFEGVFASNSLTAEDACTPPVQDTKGTKPFPSPSHLKRDLHTEELFRGGAGALQGDYVLALFEQGERALREGKSLQGCERHLSVLQLEQKN